MCDAPSGTLPRPRWSVLYALVVVAAVTGLAIAVVVPPGLVTNVVDAALGLAVLGAAAFWVRANRVALDLDGWCDCATEHVTMRVIQSRQPDVPDAVPALPGVSVRVRREDDGPAVTA